MKTKLQKPLSLAKPLPVKISVYSRGLAGDRLTKTAIFFLNSTGLTGAEIKQTAQEKVGLALLSTTILDEILYHNDATVNDTATITPTFFSRLAYEVYVPAVDEITVA
jgi:hypothetical protein